MHFLVFSYYDVKKLNSRRPNESNYTIESRIRMAQHTRRNYRSSKYTFSNFANYTDQEIYKLNRIDNWDSKISITKDNVVNITGEIESFNDQEHQVIKSLVQTYRKLNLCNGSQMNDNGEIITLFKLYEESKEYITHLYLNFDDVIYGSLNLNNLDVGLELLSITADIYGTLDLKRFENYPPALKTLIINYPGKYNICPENFNCGLETLVLENVKEIPQLCNLPPTVKNLVIEFNKESDSQGNIYFNNRDFMIDLANVPNSLENLVYDVQGYITNIDFTILPKTMKSIDINCRGVDNADNIKKNYKKMEEELKQHAPECLLEYIYNITY